VRSFKSEIQSFLFGLIFLALPEWQNSQEFGDLVPQTNYENYTGKIHLLTDVGPERKNQP
jgi:hypothetical protein